MPSNHLYERCLGFFSVWPGCQHKLATLLLSLPPETMLTKRNHKPIEFLFLVIKKNVCIEPSKTESTCPASSVAGACNLSRNFPPAKPIMSPKRHVLGEFNIATYLDAESQSPIDWNSRLISSALSIAVLNGATAVLRASSAVPTPENSVLIATCLQMGMPSFKVEPIRPFQACNLATSGDTTFGPGQCSSADSLLQWMQQHFWKKANTPKPCLDFAASRKRISLTYKFDTESNPSFATTKYAAVVLRLLAVASACALLQRDEQ